MATDTLPATPFAPTAPANGSPAPLTLPPSPEVVNALLRWSEDDRLNLAHLLRDSVREGFTSLAEVEQRDRDVIRRRVEQVARGEVALTDWRASLDRIEKEFREKHAV